MPIRGEVKCHFDHLNNVFQAVWKIPDYRTASMQLKSPSFGSRSLPVALPPCRTDYQYNWYLSIHPHGSRRAYNGFVSLYLYNDDDLSKNEVPNPHVKITMKMIRMYEDMASVYKQSHASKVFNASTGGFGFHHFISRHYLLDDESCFIAPDDSLSFTLIIKHLVEIDDRRPDDHALVIIAPPPVATVLTAPAARSRSRQAESLAYIKRQKKGEGWRRKKRRSKR